VTNRDQGPSEADLDAAEDALDLEDMDRGLDDALSGMSKDIPDAAAEQDLLHQASHRGFRSKRSPVLAVIVIAAGFYLLITMWSDFRYWLRSDQARDLGQVTDIYRDGAFLEDLDNEYVVLRGTPDVQHAARMKAEKGVSGYLRIREAGGSLFASVPREDERPADRFTGQFQGRIRHLGSMWNYAYVEEFFNNEQIVQTLDVDATVLHQAIRDQSPSVKVDGGEREISLGENDLLRLVVKQPEATVQLGKKTWPKKADAKEAVAALGYPFVALDRGGSQFHTFLVRIPAGEGDAAQSKLNAEQEIPEDSADPKIGAMVLPRHATYVVPPEQLGVGGEDQLVFEYGQNTTSPGYVIESGELVERKLTDGRMGVRLADLQAVRVERQIWVDPDGYVVVVEETPSDKRMAGLLFLLVCGLVAVNLASLAITARRLRA
jgi:hypothetical protein